MKSSAYVRLCGAVLALLGILLVDAGPSRAASMCDSGFNQACYEACNEAYWNCVYGCRGNVPCAQNCWYNEFTACLIPDCCL